MGFFLWGKGGNYLENLYIYVADLFWACIKWCLLIGPTLYRVAYLAGVYMLEALAIVLGAVLLC